MTNDPACAPRSRLLMAGFMALLVPMGLFFVVAGSSGMKDGQAGSWFPALLGLQMTALGMVGSTAMLRSRHVPSPAVEVEGGVALPLRHGYTGRQMLLAITLGSLLLPGALQDDNHPLVVAGAVALVLGVAAAVWLPLGGADSFRIRLTPDELVLPTGWGPVQRFPWRRIAAAQAVPRWQPILVVIPKGEDAKTGLVKVLGQGWDSQALTRVIEHYAKHASRRSDLTSAAAVEAVAFGAAISTTPERRR